MKQKSLRFTKGTRGTGFTDLTDEVQRFVSGAGIGTGLLTLFIPHTSASLLIQENADPDVLREDRKSTRLNSSHQIISYAVFCLKKKKHKNQQDVHVKGELVASR